MAITIRILFPDDWQIFCAFWMEGMNSHPQFFGGYDARNQVSPAQWRTIIEGPSHQLFGLFDDARLIGITAAFARREDPAGETAIFGMSFIMPEYRGRGLSRLFYDARLTWIRARPGFRRVVLSHHVSNAASRAAHRRYGFVLTDVAPGQDGNADPEEFYELAMAR